MDYASVLSHNCNRKFKMCEAALLNYEQNTG